MIRESFDQRDKQREREKKNKFRTRKVKQAIATQATEAAKLNTEIQKQKNPEMMVAERVEIADVLRRIIKEDKRRENLPTLSEYLKWLMEKIDQKSEGELILDWGKECESKSDKVGGPGGQNVNKVDSAWSMKHKYLLVRVKKGERRDQVQNRVAAEDKMSELVNKHIDIWLEKLTSISGDWRKVVLETLKTSYTDLLTKKKVQVDNSSALEEVCKKVLGIDIEKK